MKNKIIVLFGLIVVSFGFTGICNAAAIITDDFNSYTNGNLTGQGKWIGTSATVQGAVVYEGTKAVKLDSSNGSASMRILGAPLINDGSQTFYIKNNGDSMWIRLREGDTSDTATQKAWISINANVQNKIAYFDNDLATWVTLGDIPSDWFAIQIQWRSSDHKVRYRVNDGSWSEYVTTSNTGSWVSGLNVIYIQTGVSIYGTSNVSYIDAVQENPINSKTPVLIVPGLMGTEMKNADELLWADILRMFAGNDAFMDPLVFNSDLTPSNPLVSTSDVIESKFTSDYTEGLKNEFTSLGYVENENLFTFPYDWRYGVSGKYGDGKTNADLLAQKIQDIITQTGSNKVDVIAHSMGGLIVKKYVINHSTDHHINKAVFVGVPNTGAPFAIKVLFEGDNFDIKLLKVPFLSKAEIKKISANLPAAYDLLPSQKYYDAKGSFVKIFDEGSLMDLNDQTVKELNYQEFGSFLINDHSFNNQAFTGAGNLHTIPFDDFDLRTTGMDLYAIDGCKAGTIGKIIEHRFINIFGQHSTEYKSPKFTPGDGTVPLESATNLPIDQSHKFYSLSGEHSKMMSQNGSRQQIVNVISGSNLEVNPDLITQNIEECELNGKAISVFSPIDILVTDQNGNRLGNAHDGSILSEIPNASFEVFGDSSSAEALADRHTFLYLPTDEGQVYTIKIKGTGTGTYTITSQNIADNQVTGTEVFSNLPVTNQLTGQINLGLQTTLTVQQNPNSQSETIVPSSVINANQSEDFAPPISSITLSGTVGQPGFYRSDVDVEIKVTDTGENASGVLALNYNLDGTGYQKVSAHTFAFQATQEGRHTLTYFATDKAGNNEQEKTVDFTIDKTAPEAVVEFDLSLKDLKFSAQNDPLTTVIDNDGVILFTDQAGNTTEITLKDKDRKKSMSAEIKLLAYNGVMADISKNIMQYKWKYDNSGNLKEFSQHVKSKKEYNIKGIFDGKNTKVTGKDASGNISNSFSGLKIIKVSTNKGDFEWSY